MSRNVTDQIPLSSGAFWVLSFSQSMAILTMPLQYTKQFVALQPPERGTLAVALGLPDQREGKNQKIYLFKQTNFSLNFKPEKRPLRGKKAFFLGKGWLEEIFS